MPQIYTPETIQLLSAHFQRRYEPNFALGNAASLHQGLPMLRGYWPFSSVDERGSIVDMSEQGRILYNAGSTPFGVTVFTNYANLTPGSSQYFYRPDEEGFDITNGLTIGGWYKFDSVANTVGLIGKWNDNGVNQRSYLLYFNSATGFLTFSVSSNGTLITSVASTAFTDVTGWHHIVGRYNQSTELAVFTDGGNKVTNLVAIPAAIFNSTAQFCVGAYANGASGLFDGRITQQFLCNAVLPDAMIFTLYQQTRAMIGV